MKELGSIIENGELVILDPDGKDVGKLRLEKCKTLLSISLLLYQERGKSCDDFTNDSKEILKVMGNF